MYLHPQTYITEAQQGERLTQDFTALEHRVHTPNHDTTLRASLQGLCAQPLKGWCLLNTGRLHKAGTGKYLAYIPAPRGPNGSRIPGAIGEVLAISF